MIDSWRAIFGLCPWCHEYPPGPWERFMSVWPMWLAWWDIRYNRLWKLGYWWHRQFHLPKEA